MIQAMFFDIITSTRRKALYKHIFQKVDKDRDNAITVKVHISFLKISEQWLELNYRKMFFRRLLERLQGNA